MLYLNIMSKVKYINKYTILLKTTFQNSNSTIMRKICKYMNIYINNTMHYLTLCKF